MTSLDLRHTVATVAYRAAKAIKGAPDTFSDFRPGPGSRTAGEILAHMGDLFDWALTQAKGTQTWRNAPLQSWSADTDRFFAALTALDAYLATNETLGATPEKLFQGAIADALTHVGQIAMMRRLAGAQIRGENYYKASIATGLTSAAQPAPAFEFD